MTDETNGTTVTQFDAADIAANPTKYHFTWVYRDLNKGRDQKTLLRANAPHFDVPVDGMLEFAKQFPKVLFSSFNGTSLVIRGQNTTRQFLANNPKATDQQIKEHLVKSVLLSQITRLGGGRTRYIGADGKEYDTLAAAQAAGHKAPTAISEADLAAQFMADAIDMGVDPAIARIKAAEKWPNVFAATDTTDDDEADENETNA